MKINYFIYQTLIINKILRGEINNNNKLKFFPVKVVRSQKLDNFASKNSNIIIEGLFWKRKN